MSTISRDLEERLRILEEERRRLEELKRNEPPKEKKRPEVKRLVKIFNKASLY